MARILLAWRNPKTGEIRAGGRIHADLLSGEELDAVLEVVVAEVGRATNRGRVYRACMGFWDADKREFLTREEAVARGGSNVADAPVEVVKKCR